eukprot:GEMP01048523.1.p1 GENE.GEMP01048523.1~~GEMP01048523.1.p1  ORF type:complete len:116 (+),score=37.74 GEMP01048523.1:24-371(+)
MSLEYNYSREETGLPLSEKVLEDPSTLFDLMLDANADALRRDLDAVLDANALAMRKDLERQLDEELERELQSQIDGLFTAHDRELDAQLDELLATNDIDTLEDELLVLNCELAGG